MTAVLAACSSSDSGGSADSGDDGGGESATSAEALAEAPVEAPAAAQDRSTASTGKSGAGNDATARPRAGVQLDRAVISSGTVSLQADDVAEARREVQRVVDAARGQVSEETTDSDDDGDAVYARLVVRVPAPGFGEAMTSLEGVATLRSSQRTSEDVTTQVIDTEARLRAQQASLERVEALFGRADRLQQIVWIESQLTQRQADLDSLRQQQTWLADQTSLATITVDIERTTHKSKEKEDDDAGFLAGLDGGMKALAAAATAMATVAGALLPFALLLALLGTPLWLLRRGVRRRRPAAQA
jgi:hypothetical protein